MNQGPGQQPGRPQYSPDGRWWWDGQQWVAVQRPAAPATSRKRPPLILWLGIGGVLVLMGVCTVAVASSQGTKGSSTAQRTTRTAQASTVPASAAAITPAASASPQPAPSSAATSPPTPIARAAPPPPVAVSRPAPAPVSTCSASVKFRTPGDGGAQTVYVRSNVPSAPVTIVVHYKTTDHTFTAATDGAGNASDTFSIGRPTIGYQVNVDVSAGSAHCSTSFTPQ